MADRAHRCPATKVETVNGEPVTRQCSRLAGNHDWHQWMRPGHAVRWRTTQTPEEVRP